MLYRSTPLIELFRRSESKLRFGSDPEITCRELALTAEHMASGLSGLGLAEGDRMAIRMTNRIEFLSAFLAAAAGGFVAVAVNTRYSDTEARRLLERSGARLLVSDDEIGDTPKGAAAVQRLGSDDLARMVAADGRLNRGGPENRCVVFTTSGTTSEPKMVVHRQASITDHASDLGASGVYRSDDVAMIPMPLCGVFGLTSLLAAVASDCRMIIIPEAFEVETVAIGIAEHSVSVLNGSDDMFHRLLSTGADLSSIRLGGYARFNTSLDGIVERADERGMTLVGLYGMSEVQAMFTVRDPGGEVADRAQAGGTITSPRARARVVESELQLKGPSLFEGYLADGGSSIDETLTEEAMDSGWFRTGDSALQPGGDESREFTFVARIGDVLRIGGFLVAPAEIEQVVMGFGGFSGAQVVAVDRPSGARPVAFVVLGEGRDGRLDEEAIKAHCAASLARFKVPIRFFVVDSFPMGDGPNGPKVLSGELRRMAINLLEATGSG